MDGFERFDDFNDFFGDAQRELFEVQFKACQWLFVNVWTRRCIFQFSFGPKGGSVAFGGRN